MNRTLRISAILCIALAGFAGCDDDSDDGNGSGSGSGSPLGSLFGNGSASGGQSDGGGETGGGETGGGETGGGSSGLPSGGQPVPVDQGSCAEACAGLIQCYGATCGFELTAEQFQAAVSECTPDCLADASDADLGAVQQLVADQCDLFSEFAAQEGLCDDIDAEDFTEPSEPSTGGGSAPTGDCAATCSVTFRCLGDEAAEVFGTEAQCTQFCQQAVAEGDPEAIADVNCISANQNLSCEAIAAACDGEDEGF